ncbi:hypothetical protein GALMADRAFT_274819 [Galerina marginata CBS 339.88]|uniref:Transmembrane protein n=1 Tax=Galerina marginata (strain CBS 339.88) TaxID=685588 RepID=A0A067U3Y4_GALM3|nr:hypothetical protein GALMADRAFT_274819 [Galerina marginata CBS 339.88]
MSNGSPTRYVLVDDTDPGIQYGVNWTSKGYSDSIWTPNGYPLNHTAHESDDGAQFSYSFTGTGIQVYGANSVHNTQPTWNFTLFQRGQSTGFRSSGALDGTLGTNQLLIYEVDSLPNVDYTLVATVQGTVNDSQPAILDYILYTPAPVENGPSSASLKVLANDPSIQYGSGWKNSSTSMIATDKNLNMTFNFIGSSITWVGSYQNFSNFGAEAIYSIDSAQNMSFLFPSRQSAIQNSVEQQNQVYFKALASPLGNHTISVWYLGDGNTTPLVLDYFIVEQPWAPLPSPSSAVVIQVGTKSKMPVIAALSAIVGVLFVALLISLCLWGRSKRKHTIQIQQAANVNNAISAPQVVNGHALMESEWDGK